MIYYVIRVIVHLASFALAFWGLSSIDFSKLIRKGKTTEAQILMLGLSMGLGYLIAQFLFAITNDFYL